MTQDKPRVENVVKPWEDKKDYEAIFRKYITIGDDGEEHYDVIEMERDAQRAVRRITDHQEIVKQLIQFPPEMDKNWVRDGLAKLGQISKLPNWQRIVVLCIHNTTSALNS